MRTRRAATIVALAATALVILGTPSVAPAMEGRCIAVLESPTDNGQGYVSARGTITCFSVPHVKVTMCVTSPSVGECLPWEYSPSGAANVKQITVGVGCHSHETFTATLYGTLDNGTPFAARPTSAALC
jgi:hypothetical protein